MSFKLLVLSFAALSFVVSGCASSAMKQRKEQRDKVAQNSRLYCEFINGEIYNDIDVALNLEMAKRCDPDKPYTLTQYKTPSENQGILYCCTMGAGKSVNPVAVIEKKSEKKSTEKKPAEKKAAESEDIEE